jgi:hypothetical protein
MKATYFYLKEHGAMIYEEHSYCTDCSGMPTLSGLLGFLVDKCG